MSHSQDKSTSQAATRALRADTLAGSVALLVGMACVQRLVGFVRSVLFCRWLDPEQLGEWDMAYGFLIMAAPVAVIGLPGSFGRYLEQFRQKGQLRTILRRTGTVSAVLAIVAMLAVGLAGPWFSQWIFGRPDRADAVVLLAIMLVCVIGFNFLTEMLTGLRMFRVVSVLQFVHSALFAALGLGLLCGWRRDVDAVVVGFGGACLLSGICGLVWMRHAWRELPPDTEPLPHRQLWTKLLPYAMWMWVSNLLYNLFEVADRYMLLHFSGADSQSALAAVGNYHSSRVVPVLLVTLAAMLGGLLTPHLSHDWEAGRRRAVAARLNLTLKLLGLVLLAVATAVLAAAPFLFGSILHGKYDGGLAVLPWTLTYCLWLSLATVAQNYLWCAERAKLGSLALLLGLAVNVALNLWWVPRFGLMGAVWATAVAKLTAMTLIFAFNRRLGMTSDPAVWFIAALPIALAGGPLLAAAVLAAVLFDLALHDRLLTAREKAIVGDALGQFVRRLRRRSIGNALSPTEFG